MAKESSYYPVIQSYLRNLGYVCQSKDRGGKKIPFITKGIAQTIMDVFGIRSATSKFSAELEVVAVEVKRSRKLASLRNMHQALNNSKVAHYCYLAMPRKYSDKERRIAAEMGIGLLTIGPARRGRLESQSARFSPDRALLREFLRKNLKIAQCSICDNFASLYDIPEGQHREGGGWRDNVFSGSNKWVYFCKQCRERFENLWPESRFRETKKKIERLARAQKRLKRQIRSLRERLRKRSRGPTSR